jgi:arginine/lysine/ornithine decarboxylase
MYETNNLTITTGTIEVEFEILKDHNTDSSHLEGLDLAEFDPTYGSTEEEAEVVNARTINAFTSRLQKFAEELCREPAFKYIGLTSDISPDGGSFGQAVEHTFDG